MKHMKHKNELIKNVPKKISKITWFTSQSIERAQTYLINSKAFGFFDGGCLIFAQAAKMLIPSARITTILRHKKPDHYGLLLGDSLGWADASGIYQNRYLWAQHYTIQENIAGNVTIVEDFIKSDHIPRDPLLSLELTKILKLKLKEVESKHKHQPMDIHLP
jgi:hypothetical protein